jgi:dolichol-phosphate mannosyltransferase
MLLVLYIVGSWALGNAIQGWTSTMLVVVFLGAVQMFVLGMIGEYLGRLYVESKRRPLYLVADVAGPVKGHASLGYRFADSGEVTVSPHAPSRPDLPEPEAPKARAPRRKADPPSLL